VPAGQLDEFIGQLPVFGLGAFQQRDGPAECAAVIGRS